VHNPLIDPSYPHRLLVNARTDLVWVQLWHFSDRLGGSFRRRDIVLSPVPNDSFKEVRAKGTLSIVE